MSLRRSTRRSSGRADVLQIEKHDRPVLGRDMASLGLGIANCIWAETLYECTEIDVLCWRWTLVLEGKTSISHNSRS